MELPQLAPMTGMKAVTHSAPQAPLSRQAAYLALALASALGLYWLALDVVAGLQSGREFDLHRRWVVSQYVRAGINPYPLALAALEPVYGTLGGGRAKPRVYAIPRLPSSAIDVAPAARGLLDSSGTPEAVYPPSADLLLSLTLGVLPEDRVHLVGMLVNLFLLGLCAALLCQSPTMRSARDMALTVALLLLWAPTRDAVLTGQFSILVTISLLCAFRNLSRHEYTAGAWFALALIKPSLALPFLILPLIRGRWRALAVAVGVHVLATGVQAVRFGIAPWDLLRQWAGVAAYFAQGQFTLQEVLSALHLADSAIGFALVAAFILAAAVWCLLNREAADELLIDWLCFVSVLWSYHGPYDFVVLLIPLTRRLVPTPTSRNRTFFNSWLAAGLFACVSVAASPLVYGDEAHLVARLVRHAARLALFSSTVALALDMRRSARGRITECAPAANGLHGGRAELLELRA
jgi:Glycosyltransferase family 87